MQLRKQLLQVLPYLLCVSAVCRAGVVFDNGSPNQLNGAEMTHYLQADDVTVAGSLTFNLIRFWTLEPTGSGTAYNGDIIWVINENDSGNFPHFNMVSTVRGPVSRTFLQTTAVAGLAGTWDEYQIDMSIVTPVTLTPGTYWLSLHNGDYSYDANQDFYWETTGNNGSFGSYNFIRTGAPPGPWIANVMASPSEAQLAFQLLFVPEPGTSAMLASGLLGLGFAALRRRRQQT